MTKPNPCSIYASPCHDTISLDFEVQLIETVMTFDMICTQDHSNHYILWFIINRAISYKNVFYKQPCLDSIDSVFSLNNQHKQLLNDFIHMAKDCWKADNDCYNQCNSIIVK